MVGRNDSSPEQRFNRRWGATSLTALFIGAGLTWLSFVTGWPGS